MESKNYKQLLNNERNSPEMTDEEFNNTLIHFAKLYHKEQLNINEIIEITESPYFRKMKVESGWMYNFYDSEKDNYKNDWTFVPNS